MTVARILFLAKYRVPHAVLALQYDRFLTGVDYTIIASPMNQQELEPVWTNNNIDSSNFVYFNDSVIYEKYPEVNNWVFADDYRGWWLRQQAIKLAYLDLIQEDIMLMHDPDTFMIKPYNCCLNNRLNLLVLPDTKHGSYNGVFEAITGIPEISKDCFITELCAVDKNHFNALREHIQSRWPQKKWLDSIIDAVPGMPTVPPWGTGNVIKWFSEYELLGNWAVHCGVNQFQPQTRFEYNSLDLLSAVNAAQHNAVCDAIPDLRLSLQYDWDQHCVVDFDRYKQMVDQQL